MIHSLQALQHWTAVQTGTYIPPGQYSDHYNYWSGFGSVFPWSLTSLAVLGSLVVLYHHHNCAVPRCPRIAHKKYEIKETKQYTCHKHHTQYWHDILVKQYKQDYPKQYEHITKSNRS